MSKDRRKVLHIHSNVNDKQPTPNSLEVGELAVNNARNNAFISTKNSDDKVVRFSEDETLVNWMEMKEVFPYEAYVRGSDTGITGVTEADIARNKSNIIIKINQVAPTNSEYYDKINGAKDIFGNLINPIGVGNYRDGAGIAIDMSCYVMSGSNPSFSSITTTCNANFNGSVNIEGSSDACGSDFIVSVEDACIDASDTLNEYGVNNTNIGISCDGNNVSNNTTIKGKKVLIESSTGDSAIDFSACERVSAKTNNFVVKECRNGQGNVSIDTTNLNISADTTNINSCNLLNVKANELKISSCDGGSSSIELEACEGISAKTNNFVIESCSGVGKTIIKSCDEIRLESKNLVFGACDSGVTPSEMTIEVDDMCMVGNDQINIYGKETNIGLDCDNATIADTTNVYGKQVLISGGNSSTNSSIIKIENNSMITLSAMTAPIRIDGSHAIWNYSKGDIENHAESGRSFTNAKIIKNQASEIIQNQAAQKFEAYAGSGSTPQNRIIIDGITDEISIIGNGDILEKAVTGSVEVYAHDNTNRSAGKNICDNASSAATFYGEIETNVGINCDDTATAQTTTVKGGKTIIDASTTDLGLTAKRDIKESSENDIIITADNSICERAFSSATFYGMEETKIGVNCENTGVTESLYVGGRIMCLNATQAANLYSPIVNVGIDCENLNDSSVTNIFGSSITMSGDSVMTYSDDLIGFSGGNISQNANVQISNSSRYFDVIAFSGISQTSSGYFNIVANDTLCEEGKNSYFCGTETTNIGTRCDGTKSDSVVVNSNSCILLNSDVCVSGTITANGAIYSSDEKLKENIKTIGRENTYKISRVQFKQFNFKDDEEKRPTYGVIAQDLQNIGLNELVHTKEDGMLGVDYISLLILKNEFLSNEISYLQRDVEILKNKIDDLINKKD